MVHFFWFIGKYKNNIYIFLIWKHWLIKTNFFFFFFFYFIFLFPQLYFLYVIFLLTNKLQSWKRSGVEPTTSISDTSNFLIRSKTDSVLKFRHLKNFFFFFIFYFFNTLNLEDLNRWPKFLTKLIIYRHQQGCQDHHVRS
jgi:hypothetical protein